VDRSDGEFVPGRVREDAEEFKKRLIASPRRNITVGAQGGLAGCGADASPVKTDGSLSVDKIIEGNGAGRCRNVGDPAMAGAAGQLVTKRLTSSPR